MPMPLPRRFWFCVGACAGATFTARFSFSGALQPRGWRFDEHEHTHQSAWAIDSNKHRGAENARQAACRLTSPLPLLALLGLAWPWPKNGGGGHEKRGGGGLLF